MAWEGTTMEKTMTTKEKIIYESLRLFSQKGYDGVSMREIASAVGIKGASIYNHFSGKEEIFSAIFDTMKSRYEEAAVSMQIPTKESEETVSIYRSIDETGLFRMAEGLLSFFCRDEFTVMFRKLLVSEQHRSPLAAQLLKEYYFDAPILFQTQLFKELIKQDTFKEVDADIMALHFYSPIYYILGKSDLGAEYEECLRIIKGHVHSFCTVYKK